MKAIYKIISSQLMSKLKLCLRIKPKNIRFNRIQVLINLTSKAAFFLGGSRVDEFQVTILVLSLKIDSDVHVWNTKKIRQLI
jgi:hypothetical protein